MPLDWPTIIIAIGGFLTTTFAYVATRHAKTKPPKWINPASLCAGLLVIVGGVMASIESTQDGQRIQRQSDTIHNLVSNNLSLAQQFRSWSIGGDSFCYFWTPSYSLGGETSTVVKLYLSGENPVYDLRATVYDCNSIGDALADQTMDWDATEKYESDIELGTSYPNPINRIIADRIHYPQRERYSIPVPADSKRHLYQIVFAARNGYWEQYIVTIRTNNVGFIATKVIRHNPEETLWKKIPRGFPDGVKLPWPW